MITLRVRPRLPAGLFRLPFAYPRNITCSPIIRAKQMPPRPSVDEDELVEVFLKGSGPGGQKIFRCKQMNKTSSAVQLKHLPTGLVVKSQATRSREQNRKIARNILALKLEERFKGDDSRAAKLREKASKKKASKRKKAKRKYAKLDAEKAAAAGEDGVPEYENDDLLDDGAEPGPEPSRQIDGTTGVARGTVTDLKESSPTGDRP